MLTSRLASLRTIAVFALALALLTPSLSYAKGGTGGGGSSSGCQRIQLLTAEIAPRFPDALLSLNINYGVKPCDKKENIAVRTTITEVPTGTSLLDYTQTLLSGWIFTYASFTSGAEYRVRIDAVDTRTGTSLESRTVSAIAP